MPRPTSLPSREQGFTVGSVVIVLIVIAVVYGGFKFVSRMNQDNKEQAGNLQSAFEGSDQPLSEEDKITEEEEKALAPNAKARDFPIRKVEVTLDTLTVEITATLQNAFSGNCTAEIEQLNGSDHVRYVTELDNSNQCTIYIPKEKLKASKTWKHLFKFYSSDGLSRGSYPETTFTL